MIDLVPEYDPPHQADEMVVENPEEILALASRIYRRRYLRAMVKALLFSCAGLMGAVNTYVLLNGTHEFVTRLVRTLDPAIYQLFVGSQAVLAVLGPATATIQLTQRTPDQHRCLIAAQQALEGSQ